MSNKFVVKTTEEFTYDKEGRVVKKITTEESYEEETVSKATIKYGESDPFKKSVGVPNTGSAPAVPWSTVTYTGDTYNGDLVTSGGLASPDSNGITQNITVNTNNQNAEEIANTVKKAIERHGNNKSRPFSD